MNDPSLYIGASGRLRRPSPQTPFTAKNFQGLWTSMAQRFTPPRPVPAPPTRPSRTWSVAVLLSVALCGCYHNVFGSEFDTCEEVNAEMKEELSGLQACSVDADCGQVLEGTSCGCTNDLVAHNDYDTTRFRALQGRAQELKCTTNVTDCSCPAANGFVCTNNVCGWNYVK